jgi:2-keto-3-deoxy-L-fuconate dehydrogenase
MTGRLAGKTAFITAAGQGIGRAIAEAYIKEGAQVIATDVAADKLDGLNAMKALALDARSTPAVEQVIKDAGRIDILVNCAGYVAHGTVLDCDERTWDFSFDLNVKSMHRTIQAALPGMLERGGGSIVNIASSVSSLKAAPNRYVYAATKAAVIGLTKAVAVDFIRKGIRANAICPGTIHSPSLDERIAAQAQKEGRSEDQVQQAFIDRQPMGRLGTAEEVAALAVYLGSDESSFTTGQALLIDGGFTL